MENNLPSVEGKINKWKEVKAEYDKWLPTIELKYRKGKTIYTQIAEIFPAILDDLAILKMDFASQLAQRDKEIEKWKDAFTSVNAQLKELRQEHNNWLQRESQYIDDKEKEIEEIIDMNARLFEKKQLEINEFAKQRDHYKALAEAAEVVFNSVGDFLKTNEWISKEYNAYQSLKTQTPDKEQNKLEEKQ